MSRLQQSAAVTGRTILIAAAALSAEGPVGTPSGEEIAQDGVQSVEQRVRSSTGSS
ncbi:hypothetical protein OG948_37560 (plasmid) [Embleya sp. NBC_00888]|uniref:hypothetical protein n=1 Tax=Embleya sp. NBC_00888 TaxID=2975960 RepID=UPI002F907A18|nr:hypothetical protein OG948_37560 [Embleya sp. NBC_00888]